MSKKNTCTYGNINQPDFTKIFFDHFGRKPKKVRYELRLPPNFFHDLTFLSSLVHDARFHRKDIHIHGSRLTMFINRDCWEIPMTKSNEIHTVNSKLTFTTVKDIKWLFTGIVEPDPEYELWIDYLYVDEGFHSHDSDWMRFIVSGHYWQLQLTLNNMDYSVKLQDLEIPHLYSQKTLSKKKHQ